MPQKQKIKFDFLWFLRRREKKMPEQPLSPEMRTHLDQYVAEASKRTNTWVIAFFVANVGVIAGSFSYLTDFAANAAIRDLKTNYSQQEIGIQALLTSQVGLISEQSSKVSKDLVHITDFIEKATEDQETWQALLTSFDAYSKAASAEVQRNKKQIEQVIEDQKTLQALLTSINADAYKASVELQSNTAQIAEAIEQQQRRLESAKDEVGELMRAATTLSDDIDAGNAIKTLRGLADTLKDGDATKQLVGLRADLNSARSTLAELESDLTRFKDGSMEIQCRSLKVQNAEGVAVIALQPRGFGGAIDLFHEDEPAHRIITVSTEAGSEWGLNVWAPIGNTDAPIARMLGLLNHQRGMSDLRYFTGNPLPLP